MVKSEDEGSFLDYGMVKSESEGIFLQIMVNLQLKEHFH